MSRTEIEDFKSFFEKFVEVCYVTSFNLKEGKDPSDEGWDIMEAVHKLWFNGEVTLFKTVLDEPDGVATQGGLFDDKTAEPK